MFTISKLRIDKTSVKNFGIVLIVVLAVLAMLFYFWKTERIKTDTLASLFVKESQEEVVSEPEVDSIEIYQETAQVGDGLTHIARRAIDRYLTENDTEIGAERRVYCEDYIQKSMGSYNLSLGEEVSVSTDLIAQSIEASSQLSQDQIENLKTFSSHLSL
jgi:hypothetical protein